jgi:alcohol dehydrogenase
MKQKMFSGIGSHETLAGILQELNPQKILCVTGKCSYQLCGAEDSIGKMLKPFHSIRFSDYAMYPEVDAIARGVDVFKKEGCDLVIGIGGGAAIDIAKSISFLGEQKGCLRDYLYQTEKPKSRQKPLIVIPTTAGTGSEATHFSVIYIEKKKHSLAHSTLLPDYVILDPLFTKSQTKYLAACVGLDALCQAIESYWSIGANEESKAYSKKAIELILENICKSINSPNEDVRMAMLMGSHYAGKAINLAKTTAAHALSYPFTSCFNIPHGHAVSLTLPYLIELNAHVSKENIQDPRGVCYVEETISELCGLLGVDTPEAARDLMLKIMREVGLDSRLSHFAIGENNLKDILDDAMGSTRMQNNPIRLSRDVLFDLLTSLL